MVPSDRSDKASYTSESSSEDVSEHAGLSKNFSEGDLDSLLKYFSRDTPVGDALEQEVSANERETGATEQEPVVSREPQLHLSEIALGEVAEPVVEKESVPADESIAENEVAPAAEPAEEAAVEKLDTPKQEAIFRPQAPAKHLHVERTQASRTHTGRRDYPAKKRKNPVPPIDQDTIDIEKKLTPETPVRKGHAAEKHIKPRGEGAPSQRVEVRHPKKQPVVAEAPAAPEAPAAAVVPKTPEAPVAPLVPTETAKTTEAEKPKDTRETFYNGEKVELGEPFTSPDGKESVYRAKRPDGSYVWVSPGAIAYGPVEASKAAFAVNSEGRTSILDKEIKAKSPFVPTFAVNTAGETEVLDDLLEEKIRNIPADPRVEQERQEALRLEQERNAKKWWQKAGDFIRKRAGLAYWAAQFDTYVAQPSREKWSKWLEHDVNDSMTDEEKKHKREDNRIVAIAAGAGVALVIGVGVGLTVWASQHGGISLEGLNGHGGGGGGGGHDAANLPNQEGWLAREEAHQAHLESLREQMAADVDTSSVTTPEVASAPPEIIIGDGEGGQALFERLHIDSSKWYDNQWELVQRFPQDFEPHGNGVWIRHQGPLSPEAQAYINALR